MGPHMAPMRMTLIALLLAAATPAMAQSTFGQIEELRAQQEAAARRAVAQANELTALEARLKTEQALSDLQTQRLLPPRAPELTYTPGAPGHAGATPRFPSIPDAALADSNRRVRAASQPKR